MSVASFMRNACNLSLLRYTLVLGGITRRFYMGTHAQLRPRKRARGRGALCTRLYVGNRWII